MLKSETFTVEKILKDTWNLFTHMITKKSAKLQPDSEWMDVNYGVMMKIRRKVDGDYEVKHLTIQSMEDYQWVKRENKT